MYLPIQRYYSQEFSIPNGFVGDLGDFQTPTNLTDKICQYLSSIGINPKVLIEPTCGKGNFVLSAIKYFPSIRYIYCVELQEKYEWLFKLNIAKQLFTTNFAKEIEFHRDNIFFHKLSAKLINYINDHSPEILILGNPPWVTSSELSILNSNNIPLKENIKKVRGIEAITGKGNFDIAEYVLLRMLKLFKQRKAKMAMLCKTSVVKNIIKAISDLDLAISNMYSLKINAKKEFNISADATLFVATVGMNISYYCKEASFYEEKRKYNRFGWTGNKFASDIDTYKEYKEIDGISPFEWRQGVKHDVAKIMVLKRNADGILFNGLKEKIDIEDDILYPFIKGSGLQKQILRDTEYKIIITQKSTGEETQYIKERYPKIWNYLDSHISFFKKRRSIVYKNRPKFSLFGIGSYAFKPYKIAISGLYKTPNFCLILPMDNKPVMLDDTSYYISFDDKEQAIYTWVILNSEITKKFLSSIVFLDTKRPYTKEILMRIDIREIVKKIKINGFETKLREYINFDVNEDGLNRYLNSLPPE